PRLFEPKETVEEAGAEKPKVEEKKDVSVTIDFEGANQRIVAFPFPSGRYWGLQPVEGALVYLSNSGLNKYNLQAQKNDVIMAGIFGAT
ncbi:hypothetical protein, partial [Pseudomonas shirazica]|uniref:hypothetical protein n=1 Tax=Pseudomonas shirazica TaxID=1940636 RepID=UPI0015D65F30